MSNRHRFTADGIPHYPDVEEAIKSSGIALSEIVFFELDIRTEIEDTDLVNLLREFASYDLEPPQIDVDRITGTITAKHTVTLFVILKDGSERNLGALTRPIRYV